MPRSHRWLLVIIFVLLVPGLFWGLPSAITPQDDASVPTGPLLFFVDRNPHIDTVYPPFHQLLLMPLYGVVVAFFWITGGLAHLGAKWPYGFHDVSLFFSAVIVVGNLVSALMAIAVLRSSLSFLDEDRKWAWAGLLLLGTNGIFVYYARVGNFDMPYMFWWAIGLWFLWGYFFRDRPFRASVIPAAVACACAAGSKDQASALAIGAGLLLVMLSPGGKPLALGRRLRNCAVFFATLAVAYAVVAILPHPLRWWNHARFVVGPHAPTEIPMSAAGQVWILGRTLLHLSQVYPLPVLAVTVVGAFVLRARGRGREVLFLTLPLLTYYLLIIAKTRVAHLRFMLPAGIPILVLVTYGVAAIYGWAGKRYGKAWLASVCIFLVWQFAFRYVPLTYAQTFDLKRAVAADLPSILEPGRPLLISRMQTYNFPNRDVYNLYRLMMLPQDPIVPPSRHAANVLHALDPAVGYYLLGTGTVGLPGNTPGQYPVLNGDPVREWRFPQWVWNGVQAPVLYEFTLYRRTGALPLEARSTP